RSPTAAACRSTPTPEANSVTGVMYVPPLLEPLGRAEVEHNKRGSRMRAI
ncbi:MAG: hypothetical protein JWM72_392, partial [Actinomycetia bacterium]|nr:hypothetical protein [Actinomycetes bacterium]